MLLSIEEESIKGPGEGINLTVEERTLLHLLEYHRFTDSFEVPEDITQLGISRAINIHQKHVPRTIKKLVEKEFTDEKTSRITGLKQKRKAYFLSPTGLEEARKIREFISDREVSVVTIDGKTFKVPLRDVSSKLNENVHMVEVISYAEQDGTFNEKNYYTVKEELEREQETTQIDAQRRYDIYRAALEEAWDDSVMTIDERAILEGLRIKLGISEKEHRRIEDEVLQLIELPSTNREIYRVALLQAHADGRLSDDELQMLDKLRSSLNISEAEHKKLEEDIVKKVKGK